MATRSSTILDPDILLKEQRRYIEKTSCQPLDYKNIRVSTSDGVTVRSYQMTRKTFDLSGKESWEHAVTIYLPPLGVESQDLVFIAINNGANEPDKPIVPNYSEEVLKLLALAGIRVLAIDKVPNQPFIDSQGNKHYEDALRAKRILMTLHSLEGDQDHIEPLIETIMSGSIVDSIRLFEQETAISLEETRAVISGASKQATAMELACMSYGPLQKTVQVAISMCTPAMPRLADQLARIGNTPGSQQSLPDILLPYKDLVSHSCRQYYDQLMLAPSNRENYLGSKTPLGPLSVYVIAKKDNICPLPLAKQVLQDQKQKNLNRPFILVETEGDHKNSQIDLSLLLSHVIHIMGKPDYLERLKDLEWEKIVVKPEGLSDIIPADVGQPLLPVDSRKLNQSIVASASEDISLGTSTAARDSITGTGSSIEGTISLSTPTKPPSSD